MRAGRPPIPLNRDYILKRIAKMPSGCWHWVRVLRPDGYGKAASCGKQYLAHRLAYCIWTGMDMKSEMLVLHKCNNKRCVNPDHLYAGTQAQNVQDALNAGALYGLYCKRGTANPNSKLSLTQAREIEQLLKTGLSLTRIARRHGVSTKPVYEIRYRKHWSQQ